RSVMVGDQAEKQIELLASQRISRRRIAVPVRGPSRVEPYVAHILWPRARPPSRPIRPECVSIQCQLQHFRQMKCFPPRGLQYLFSTAKAIGNNQSFWRGLSNGGQQDPLS